MNFKIKNLLFFLAFIFLSCNPYFKNSEEDNSPTSGILKVYTDTSIAPVIRVFARTFESQYPNATVTVVSDCRENLLKLLHENKAKAIVLPDSMAQEEMSAFSKDRHYIKRSRLCFSSISFFYKKSDTSGLSASDVSIIMDALQDPEILAVLPPKCSDVPYYIFKNILQNSSFKCKIRFTSPDSLAFYVKNEKGMVFGALEHSMISDLDDPKVKTFFSDFKLLAFRSNHNDTAYLPDPTNFELKKYPFIRAWHYYRNAPEFSLAKGFESFMAGEQGQRLFLKFGLLPARKPERNIKVVFEKSE
ncbi:MAG: substrate-binding domain-containing protein [Bacteroidia bacterium]|nr:substrate-binding domain-containing protein [Bacteroidia bacterium]